LLTLFVRVFRDVVELIGINIRRLPKTHKSESDGLSGIGVRLKTPTTDGLESHRQKTLGKPAFRVSADQLADGDWRQKIHCSSFALVELQFVSVNLADSGLCDISPDSTTSIRYIVNFRWKSSISATRLSDTVQKGMVQSDICAAMDYGAT
jgi:hypothetical protein